MKGNSLRSASRESSRNASRGKNVKKKPRDIWLDIFGTFFTNTLMPFELRKVRIWFKEVNIQIRVKLKVIGFISSFDQFSFHQSV